MQTIDPEIVWLGGWRRVDDDTYKRRCRRRGFVWDAVLYRFVNTANGTESWRRKSVLSGSTRADLERDQ